MGSDPKIEPVIQDQREVNPDAENAKMKIPHDGTFCQRMMPQEEYMGILQVHGA